MPFSYKWSTWSLPSRALFVLHIALMIIMLVDFAISFTFRDSPPAGFFVSEEDKTVFTAFLELLFRITLAGSIITILFSAVSILAVVVQKSGVFCCSSCTSVMSMIVLIVCFAVPLIFLGGFTAICENAKDECYQCADSMSEDDCSAAAYFNGFECYYTEENYNYLCVTTTSKLWYVVCSFVLGALLEFAFSVMSCVSMCTIKRLAME